MRMPQLLGKVLAAGAGEGVDAGAGVLAVHAAAAAELLRATRRRWLLRRPVRLPIEALE